MATSKSGIDFEAMTPKGSSGLQVLEVLEPVPDGVIATDEARTNGRFRSLQALATRVYRDSMAQRKADPDAPLLSVREVEGVPHVVRLAG